MYKFCTICDKKRFDSSYLDGGAICKFCKKDIEKKFNQASGIFKERLVTCPVCEEQKGANASNFRGGIKNGEFILRSLNCNICIEREYRKIDNNLHERKLKKCNKCNGDFPNDLRYFGKNYRNRDFLEKSCKECLSKVSLDERKDKYIDGVLHHKCRECGDMVPRGDFHTKPNGTLIKRCKSCVKRVEEEIKNVEFRIKESKCKKCGEYKELKEFEFRADCKDYVKPLCRKCSNERQYEYDKKRRGTL